MWRSSVNELKDWKRIKKRKKKRKKKHEKAKKKTKKVYLEHFENNLITSFFSMTDSLKVSESWNIETGISKKLIELSWVRIIGQKPPGGLKFKDYIYLLNFLLLILLFL